MSVYRTLLPDWAVVSPVRSFIPEAVPASGIAAPLGWLVWPPPVALLFRHCWSEGKALPLLLLQGCSLTGDEESGESSSLAAGPVGELSPSNSSYNHSFH
jgi:hypothetical protein